MIKPTLIKASTRMLSSPLNLVLDASVEDIGASASETQATRVARGLRQMIVKGEVKHGTWLRMQNLADKFGVSVQPIREALQLLQGEGLVELHPNRGGQVRGLDRTRLKQIYEIRSALESFMARQFADDASQSEIRTLERIQAEHDRAMEARDLAELRRLNGMFHSLINQRGGNLEAAALISRYYDLSSALRENIGFADSYWHRVRTEHHGLLEAIRRHDGSMAADIGSRHVLGSLHDHLNQFDMMQSRAKTQTSEHALLT
jgi:DNA-binding GntR family transcriptional regulator